MDKQRLARIEEYVFGRFRAAGTTRLLAREVFDGAADYANADLVRAFEDLEKTRRLLVRYTDEGNDWLQLTPEGAAHAGLDEPETPAVFPHPPKSSPQ